MNTALLVQYGVPAVVAVVSALVGHWHGKRSAKPAPAKAALPLPGNVGSLVNDPIVQAVLSKLVQTAHDTGHAALDAAVVKLMPGLAPFVPAINSVVDAAEAKVVKQ